MTPTQQLAFLQSKIMQARTAIFTNQGDSLYKIRTTVVQVLRTDKDGALWFVVPRPAFYKNTLDPVFPVQMDFRRKGLNFNVQVTGTGELVDDQETIYKLIADTHPAADLMCDELLAVRVKMQSADYFEAPEKQINSLWKQLQSAVEAWWQPQDNHRVFQF